MIELRNLFLLFMIYSIIGWIVEIIDIYFYTKKIANRGFLIGPYCPIYGVGAIIMTFIFNNANDDLFGIFAKAMIVCGILEYLTSYIMEKMFKKRWWDYSHRKYNLNGRVCLENIVLFGLSGCILVKFTNPFFIHLITIIPDYIANIISIILAIIFISDLVISVKIVSKLKNVKFKSIDSTNEIKEKMYENLNLNYITKRLINAFPQLNESKLRKKS